MFQKLKFKLLGKILTFLFASGAKRKKGRATHMFGVGGKGTLRIVDSLAIPEHNVWQAGRTFNVTLRHANLNLEDDLGIDYRGAALKLEREGKQVIDLLMNTGKATVWCHVAMFAERMFLTLLNRLPTFYKRYPPALERYYAGLRRAPDSYQSLAYYSKIVSDFWGMDGKRHCVKYRLIPKDWDGTESGKATQRDRDAGLALERWPEETRPKNHLRQTFKQTLHQGEIHYTLQIVVRDYVQDYTNPFYNPCLPWHEEQYPWLDLAEITLNTVVDDATLEAMQFSIGNAPKSLGVLPAKTATEFTSVGHLRKTLYPAAAAKRPK